MPEITAGIGRVLVCAVVVLAAGLRLGGLHWGLPDVAHPNYSYHPDESRMMEWAQELAEGKVVTSQFIYGGTLHMSILYACIRIAAFLPPGEVSLLADAILIARILEAAASCLTVLVLYQCGRRLFDARIGLLAALVLALAPGAALLGTTARPDGLSMLASVLFLYLAIRIWTGAPPEDRRWLVLTGLLSGVTLALRFPVAAFGAGPLLALWLREGPQLRGNPARAVRLLGLLALITLASYLAASPHTVLYLATLIDGLLLTWNYETSEFADGIDRGPSAFQYGWRMLRESLGAPLHILCLASVIGAAAFGQTRHRLILLSALPYFLLTTMATWIVVRYTLPLLPWLALLTAAGIAEILRHAGRWRRGATAAVLVALLWTATQDSAFLLMLRQPDTRDLVAAWIRVKLPPQSAVVMFEQYDGDAYFNPVIEGRPHYIFPLRQDTDPNMLPGSPFAEFLVLHENIYADLDRLRDAHPTPELRALRSVLDGRYELMAEFKKPVTLLGLPFSSYYTAVDYRVMNPGIRIYRRASGSVGDSAPANPS